MGPGSTEHVHELVPYPFGRSMDDLRPVQADVFSGFRFNQQAQGNTLPHRPQSTDRVAAQGLRAAAPEPPYTQIANTAKWINDLLHVAFNRDGQSVYCEVPPVQVVGKGVTTVAGHI